MQAVTPDVGVDARELGLVDHGEFEFLGFGGGFLGFGGGWGLGLLDADGEVEGSLQDGGVGDCGYGGEGEEDEGFFKGPGDSGAEEEEESWDGEGKWGFVKIGGLRVREGKGFFLTVVSDD